MNALELADELERLYQQDIIDGVADLSMPEAATMLRQQHTSLISDVEVIERLAKEIQVKDEAIFNSQKQAYNLAMQVQNQKALIKQLEETQVYLYKTHDADKAEIEALKRCLANAIMQIDRKASENCNGFCGEYECKENQAECKRKAQEK